MNESTERQVEPREASASGASHSNRKRVAKNTLFLAGRQLIVMAVTLYTSRIILQALGIVDFGVYNVVAGITVSFSFMSVSLATATQRFLNYEMGKENAAGVRRYFSLSLLTLTGFALLVIIVGSLFGPWLVYDVLDIPLGSQTSALVVYFAMLFYGGCTIVFSVYDAAMIARERMTVFAYIGVLDAVMKLGVAFLVMVLPYKLMLYGILLALSTQIPRIIQAIYCYRHFDECHPVWFWDKTMTKKLLGFSGWNIYSSVVYMINEQGLNVVLNMFFGPVVNAARGITQQVSSAVMVFNNNFFLAVRPQIVKSYAAENYGEVTELLSFSSRTSAYLVWIIGLPIFFRAPQILGLWLTEVPAYTVDFVRWIVFYCLAGTFFNPVQTLAQATGYLRTFSLVSLTLFLLAFPVSIVIVMLGAPAWAVYPVLVITRFLSAVVAVPIIRKYIPVSFGWYIVRIVGVIFVVLGLTFVAGWLLDGLFAMNFGGLVLYGCSTTVTIAAVVLAVGLSASERRSILRKIRTKIFRKR